MTWLDTNCCLHKSPEEVLSRVDFPIDMSLSFLQHNCISHLEFISLRRQRKAAEKCTDEPLPEEDCLAAIEVYWIILFEVFSDVA